MEPPELPPELLPEPVLGELLLGEVVVLPLAPVPAPELDLLKWASHSEREIVPSLFVSTAEKFGAEELELAPPLVPPDADGEDEDLSLLEDEELCAAAKPDSANSAAAVAALTNLRFNIG